MDENRSVLDVLRELTGSGDTPGAVADALRAAGHDLPGDLVVEAVASFADTAPAAVAEHLAPFTTAYGPEGLLDPVDLDAAEMLPDGLALLASAPAVGLSSDGDVLPDGEAAGPGEALAFGTGAGTRDDDGEGPDDRPDSDGSADETLPGDDLADHGPAGDNTTSAGLNEVLPASDDFALGNLGTEESDETFDPADLEDPADLDAEDGQDADVPL